MAKRLFQQSLSDHCVGRSLSFEKVVAYSPRGSLSHKRMLVADLPALVWYLAHTSACFNKVTAHIQISPVGFIVNVVL